MDVFDDAVTTTLTVTTTSPTLVNVNISVYGEIIHETVLYRASSSVVLPERNTTLTNDSLVEVTSTGEVTLTALFQGSTVRSKRVILIPVTALSTVYYMTDRHSVTIASLSGATVIINASPHNTHLLSEQEVITVNNTNGEPVYIQSSDPVYVTHHCGTEQTSHFVLGTSHWTTTYTITPPPGTSTNYITIIAATPSTTGVVVNPPSPSHVAWTDVPGTDFSYTTIPYISDFISVGHTNCTERLGVYVYGSGVDGDTVWSYAHPAGLRVDTEFEEDANLTSCDLPVWVVDEDAGSSSLLSASQQDVSLFLKTSTSTDSLSDYFLPIPSTAASNNDISFTMESFETDIPLHSSGTMSTSSKATPSSDTTIHTTSVPQTQTGSWEELIQILPSTFLASDLWAEASPTSASHVIVTTLWTASDIASTTIAVEATTIPATDVFQSGTVMKILIGGAVAVPACVTLVSLALWKGITKARTSSNFTLDESGHKTTVKSNVRQITVRSTNERLPRVQLVQKQTTMTSLRSHPGLDF